MARGYGMGEEKPQDARTQFSVDELNSIQALKDEYTSLTTTLDLYKTELGMIDQAQKKASVEVFLEGFSGEGVERVKETINTFDKFNGILEILKARLSATNQAIEETKDIQVGIKLKTQAGELEKQIDVITRVLEGESLKNPVELTVKVRKVPEGGMGEKGRSVFDLKNVTSDFVGMGLDSTMESSIQGFIDASNSGNWDDFGSAIREGMSNFLIDFGKMLIMQGTMMLIADALMSNPLSAPAGIAIGAAAIALGLAMRKKASGSSITGGGGGGGLPQQFSPLAGYSKYAASGVSAGGSNGQGSDGNNGVTFRIKGDDLVAVLDRANLKQTSLY